MNRLRRTTLAAAAMASIGLLGACTGQPSPKAVAKDVVQSLGLPQSEQDCMLDVIDEMSGEQLEALGEANVGQAITDAESGTPEMQAFIAGIADCRGPG